MNYSFVPEAGDCHVRPEACWQAEGEDSPLPRRQSALWRFSVSMVTSQHPSPTPLLFPKHTGRGGCAQGTQQTQAGRQPSNNGAVQGQRPSSLQLRLARERGGSGPGQGGLAGCELRRPELRTQGTAREAAAEGAGREGKTPQSSLRQEAEGWG